MAVGTNQTRTHSQFGWVGLSVRASPKRHLCRRCVKHSSQTFIRRDSARMFALYGWHLSFSWLEYWRPGGAYCAGAGAIGGARGARGEAVGAVRNGAGGNAGAGVVLERGGGSRNGTAWW